MRELNWSNPLKHSMVGSLIAWTAGTSIVVLVAACFLPIAICDGWFDLDVTPSRPIPNGLKVGVQPFVNRLVERLDDWHQERMQFEKYLTDTGLTFSIGHSHRSWCGYSYRHTQEYDCLLLVLERDNRDPEIQIIPILKFPKKTPVKVVIPIPDE